MSDNVPAGWYPDPQRSPDEPPRERRWDGQAWTAEVRPAMPLEEVRFGPPGQQARPARKRLLTGVAIGVGAALVVGGGIAGGLALTSDDDDGDGPAAAQPSPSEPEEGPEGGEPAPDEGVPQTEDGFATDLASGIKLPVPDGWKGQSGQIGAGVTIGEYKCPTAPKQTCVRGGVNSAPAAALGIEQTSAKAVAEKDIATNAEESYGEEAYGGVSSHKELRATEVTVAGQEGYLVRWKVATEEGSDGYVQSLAFPSPVDSKLMVIIRSGFDIDDKAPELNTMDEITQGIKAAEGGGGQPV